MFRFKKLPYPQALVMKSFTFIFVGLLSLTLNINAQDIEKLKSTLLLAKDDTTKVTLLFNIFDHYRYTYADSSLNYVQQALELSEKLKYERGIALSQLFLCETFSMLGNDPQALNYGFKALAMFEKLKDTMGICNTSTSIGNFYGGQNDYQKSLLYYNNVLRIMNAYSDKSQIFYFWGGISGIYLQINQLDSALFYADMAYRADPTWCYGLRLMASIYAQMGDIENAYGFYRKAMTSAIENNLHNDLIETYMGIAKLHRNDGRNDSAVVYASKALLGIGKSSYPSGILELSRMLAEIYESKEEKDSAMKYLKLTVAIKDELYNTEKIRAFQNISFNEDLKRKEFDIARAESQNRLKLSLSLGGLVVVLVIVGILLRNNRQKEKVNRQLSEQKKMVSQEKVKVECALKELEITQTQLVQSEKMASLGELTAGIAHEIQNPLNFITNFSQVSDELVDDMKRALESNNREEALAISQTIKQNLERINHHGKRADATVKGMLYHSRTSSGNKEPTDINALVDEYFRLTIHGLKAKDRSFNATMKSEYDPSIGEINIIPQEIGRVLLNLLSNAFYAVNDKKKQLKDGYEPIINVSTKNHSKYAEIKISDNGTGIPEKVREKIFQPFFTTKPSGIGTGLGLSLAYDIITKGHAGKINVETKEGEGTMFTILLPKQPT